MRTITASAWVVVACACGDPSTSVAPQAAPSAPATAPSTPPAPPASGAPEAPSPSSQGPVRLEPAHIDFGFVQPYTKLESTVAIVNELATPLQIIAAKPSCQCTTVDLVGKVIPARGRLDFPLSMKVSSTGLKQASVQIAVEGVDHALVVELRADVVYPIRGVTLDSGGSKVPYIDAATDPSRVRGEVTVESIDGSPFKVVSVGMKPPQFLDWDPSQAARSAYRVRYDVSASNCASMPRYLIIETDRLDAPLIDMRVRHECTHIRPKLGFAEFRANAGVISPSVPGNFEIEIKRMRTPAGMGKVLSVTSSRPDMNAELVDQMNDGESVLATVRLTPKEGTTGVMLFPLRFTVQMPGMPRPIVEELLVYCKAVP